MSKIVKKKWLNALRSDKFKQGQGSLCENGKYCCLGVLAEVTGHLKDGPKNRDLPIEKDDGDPAPFCGLTSEMQSKLIQMNDTHDKSFKEIASYISRNVKAV